MNGLGQAQHICQESPEHQNPPLSLLWTSPALGPPLSSIGQLLPVRLLIPSSQTRAWGVVCNGEQLGPLEAFVGPWVEETR